MSHQRAERVRELIREEVSRIIQNELRDPRIGLVTITGAEVSVDLQHARIFFTVLGDEGQRQQCLEGLRSASKYIRGMVGRNVQLKYTPEISFEFDRSLDHAMRIEELLSEIRENDLFPRESSEDQ